MYTRCLNCIPIAKFLISCRPFLGLSELRVHYLAVALIDPLGMGAISWPTWYVGPKQTLDRLSTSRHSKTSTRLIFLFFFRLPHLAAAGLDLDHV